MVQRLNRAALMHRAIVEHQKRSAKQFCALYADTKGVIRIEPFESIVVLFYDGDLLKEELPFEFGGVHILPYDIKEVLKDSKSLLDLLGKKKIGSLSKKDVHTHRMISRTIELCNRLLK